MFGFTFGGTRIGLMERAAADRYCTLPRTSMTTTLGYERGGEHTVFPGVYAVRTLAVPLQARGYM